MSETLPCGTEIEDLVAQVFDGVAPADPEHQAGCPHCQATLARLGAARRGLGSVRAQPVAPPSALLRDVLARVQTAGGEIGVAAGTRGRTTVAADVVSSIAQQAAAEVPGVAYASAVAEPTGAPGVVGLRVRLVLEYGPSAQDVAAAVRAAVKRAVSRLAGAVVERVDVVVDDLAH
jgi:uncharacterized alkaline shock family protein YloU